MPKPRLVVFPYQMHSHGARELARALGALRVFPNGRYRPRSTDTIINWGNSHTPQWGTGTGNWLNALDGVRRAINKKDCFAHLKAGGVQVPDVTIDPAEAQRWAQAGHTVIGRQTLTGTRGQGIVLLDSTTPWVVCPLYTKYKKKLKEFRIHVMNGQMFDAQEKRRRKGTQSNNLIRTEGNGWVFCRNDVAVPDDVKAQAEKAVAALGLFFGGVDVIWNDSEQKAYVLEVNSAPGLEGTTVTQYAAAFKQYTT